MFITKFFLNIITKHHNISPIIIIDVNKGEIITANKKACNFYGYSKKELEEINIKDLIIDKDIIFYMNSNFKTDKNYIVCKHKMAGGEVRDVKVTFNSVMSKKYFCCSLEDVTKYKENYNKTLNYAKLLSAVLEGIPDIIGVYSKDHSILFYNQAGYDFYNKNPRDIQGKKCYHMLGRSNICEICPTEKAIRTKKVIKLEKYIPELNKYMECCSSPMLNDLGEVELVVEQLRDITERKKDLNKAADLQFKSLTKEFPLEDKGEMEFSYIAAKAVSGDFFMIEKIDEFSVVGMLIDVCGKGVSAALNISALKVLVEKALKKSYDPKEILVSLNKKLIKYFDDGFTAAMCFQIDFSKRELKVSGAGLNEFILKDSNNNVKKITVKGLFLGMFEDSVFDECVVNFNEGDSFYFYSDGLEEYFNEEKFTNCILKKSSIKELKSYMDNYLRNKLHQNALRDDCTLICIKAK